MWASEERPDPRRHGNRRKGRRRGHRPTSGRGQGIRLHHLRGRDDTQTQITHFRILREQDHIPRGWVQAETAAGLTWEANRCRAPGHPLPRTFLGDPLPQQHIKTLRKTRSCFIGRQDYIPKASIYSTPLAGLETSGAAPLRFCRARLLQGLPLSQTEGGAGDHEIPLCTLPGLRLES